MGPVQTAYACADQASQLIDWKKGEQSSASLLAVRILPCPRKGLIA